MIAMRVFIGNWLNSGYILKQNQQDFLVVDIEFERKRRLMITVTLGLSRWNLPSIEIGKW